MWWSHFICFGHRRRWTISTVNFCFVIFLFKLHSYAICSSVCSFICSFFHSFIRSFVFSFICSFIRSLLFLFNDSDFTQLTTLLIILNFREQCHIVEMAWDATNSRLAVIVQSEWYVGLIPLSLAKNQKFCCEWREI